MNAQERQALQDFLQELAQARVNSKDREAEAMILQAVARQPDAPYLLVQRLLLQEQALNASEQQIRALRQQLQEHQQGHSDRFLDPGSRWGRSRSAPAPHDQYYRGAPSHYRTGHAGQYAAPYYETFARPGLMNSGMGSFLGSMAGAAAGVAAGSFLFHGIDHLLHHNDQGDQMDRNGMADMSSESAPAEQFLNDSGYEASGLAQDAGIDDVGSWDDAGSDFSSEGGDYA